MNDIRGYWLLIIPLVFGKSQAPRYFPKARSNAKTYKKGRCAGRINSTQVSSI
jgi:hypothetical protein